MGRLQMQRPPYLNIMPARRGGMRILLRRPGCKAVTLPGPLGSASFYAAYAAAMAAEPGVKPPKTAAASGTFDRLITEYLASTKFLRTKQSSQRVTRGILDRFRAEHGHRRVDQMQQQDVDRLIGEKAGTPAAANNLLKKLRVLMKFAIPRYRKDDPTQGIECFKSGEHHTWTDEQLAQFEAHHPIGSRERTVYAAALLTGQRCSDVAAMTWADINAERNTISVVQAKTGARLKIPIHRELRKALDAWPKKHVVIFPTSYGKAFASNGFGNFMAQAIEAAGLPDECVLHGLRKAAARKLAEAGCTPHQIMAITGHNTLAEFERYTKAYEQERVGHAAMARWEEHSGAENLHSVPDPVTLAENLKAK